MNATLPATLQQTKPYVVMRVGEQLFAIAVKAVRDVMHLPPLTPVPLAPQVIAGLMNQRGVIVTVLDMRARLAMPPAGDAKGMLVMVEHHAQRYALLVDTIREVAALDAADAEEVPATMNATWREVATAIHTRGKELLVILDVARVVENAVPQIEQL